MGKSALHGLSDETGLSFIIRPQALVLLLSD